MVTIKDIARESGYSVSTVSRVLNNRNDVSPDARKKIEEVVASFNFVPNNNAKHLKQNNSKAIGVLVKGISNMLFASIVEEREKHVQGAASKLGTNLRNIEDTEDYIDTFRWEYRPTESQNRYPGTITMCVSYYISELFYNYIKWE